MQRWEVEKSYMVAVPRELNVGNIQELQIRVTEIAKSKKLRKDRPPIGELSFRWELDENERPQVAHVYFRGKGDVKLRFMRLRRVN